MSVTAQSEPGSAAVGNGVATNHLEPEHRSGFWALTIGSIGVVYGDIGTSPIYAFREAIHAAAGGPDRFATRAEIFGVLSLILWALILIVTLKYVVILTRADNDGEGGTLSLMALAQRAAARLGPYIVVVGMVGAALFYGDAIITPALSVLSAVEGLEVAAPQLAEYVVPLTVLILVILFSVQSRGTARVAAFFGPVTILWLSALGIAGIFHVFEYPAIFLAIDPRNAIGFLSNHGFAALITLGAVFLAVTGAEALYTDLGHFGRKPIHTAWLFFVLPCLILNYLGQGAFVMTHRDAMENPFFMMMPEWSLVPMIILATAATVIASQAVITGCYSITRQAIQLGLLPRLEVRHTSEAHAGQIYIPRVNGYLLIGVLLLVLMFRSSTSLAAAYGISVTGTMVVDTLMAIVVVWRWWKWSIWTTLAMMVPFLLIETTFLGANLLKVFQGGWVPLILGGSLLVVMVTWRRGTRILFDKTRKLQVPLMDLVTRLEAHPPHRVPGTAVFLTAEPLSTPTALLHSLKHYKVLHASNVILTVVTSDKPRVGPDERVAIEQISETFLRVTINYGFAESPNVRKALAIARKQGWHFDIMSTSFFLSRRSVRASAQSGMPLWQDKIYIALARNADQATNYFQIPTDRVVEIGTQVTI